MRKRIIAFATVVAMLLLLFTMTSTVNADFGDTLYSFPINQSVYAVGVEYAQSQFFVSCGISPIVINVYAPNGAWLRSFPQIRSSGWGWRDLAWDGQFLYGSDDTMITKFGTDGSDHGDFPGAPISPNRAIAYNPATDTFWVAGWYTNIYEITRTGAIVTSFPQSEAIYGMAWDNISPGGPWLWVASQGMSPFWINQMMQFDPSTGMYTGVNFLFPGTAGGVAITDEWSTSFATFAYLDQGSPDTVYIYELCELGIPADVRMEPQSLNLDSNGNFVQFKVESFPDNPEYTALDVDGTTCKVLGVDADLKYGTWNSNKYIGKADRLLVEDAIGAPAQETEVQIAGKLNDGTAFKGTAIIKTV